MLCKTPFLRRLLYVVCLVMVWKPAIHAQPIPSVPPELGGPGFEKLADSLGFVTYKPQPDELFAFGDPRARTGGEIRLAMTRFPLSFRPFGQNTGYTENSIIGNTVYETLLDIHPLNKNMFVPRLASHWKVSADNRTFTFRIDPEARFSNGTPVTARDVIATWRLLMDDTILEPADQLVYGKFREPVSISPYLVEVESYAVNFRNLLYFSGMYILSADEIGSMTGTEFLQKYQYTMPVGTGEYIIPEKEVIPEQQFTFVRRENYWAKDRELYRYVGNFDRIRYRLAEWEYQKLLDGHIDAYFYYDMDSRIWEREDRNFRRGWLSKFQAWSNGPAGNNGIIFNMRKPPFDDIRVRRAFTYLFDWRKIMDELLSNGLVPGHSHFNNTDFRSLFETQYNPGEARRLLHEAGWRKKNADGILTREGQPFIISMRVSSIISEHLDVYRQTLLENGIDLQFDIADNYALYKYRLQHDFSLIWGTFTGLLIPNPETSYHSRLADEENSMNLSGIKNARIDTLCSQYDRAFTPAQREAILREIDDSLYAQCIDIPGWYNPGLRFAVWNKFGMPEWVVGRYTQRGYLDASIMWYWWYDEEKAKALEQAMEKDDFLENGSGGIQEIDYWKTYGKK